MPAARASVAEFAVHGGRLDLARAVYGGDDWLDLSTGISPWAYPARVEPLACTALPGPEALAGLEAAAAATFGHDPAATVAVPGSDIGLRMLAAVIGAARVAVVGPGYSGHVAMWDGATVSTIGAGEIAAAAETCDAVILARPNNPDGRVVDAAVLASAAASFAGRGGWLIVDEAFVDATPEVALAPQPGLIVLRSFGKFFGLAGLRLGFVVAPPGIVAALRRRLGDWPISGPAIVVGTAAYRDIDWQAGQRLRLASAKAQLDGLLQAAGFTVAGGTMLFRLVDTPDAGAVFEHLAGHAILTRPFAANPRRLRIGLPADWTRLTHALRQS